MVNVVDPLNNLSENDSSRFLTKCSHFLEFVEKLPTYT